MHLCNDYFEASVLGDVHLRGVLAKASEDTLTECVGERAENVGISHSCIFKLISCSLDYTKKTEGLRFAIPSPG